MAEHPAALQLRLLQTVVEVAAEKNSTLVLPFPVELLRFLERATPNQPPMPAPTTAPAAPAALNSTAIATPSADGPPDEAAGESAFAGRVRRDNAGNPLVEGQPYSGVPRDGVRVSTRRRQPSGGLLLGCWEAHPRTSRPGRFGTNEETPAARKVQNRAQCEAYSRPREVVFVCGVSR